MNFNTIVNIIVNSSFAKFSLKYDYYFFLILIVMDFEKLKTSANSLPCWQI